MRSQLTTSWAKGEKSTSFEGWDSKIFRRNPEERSSWEGDCFVFDARVSVRHALTEGHTSYVMRVDTQYSQKIKTTASMSMVFPATNVLIKPLITIKADLERDKNK